MNSFASKIRDAEQKYYIFSEEKPMNKGNYAEFAVSQKMEGKYKRNMLLCIALYAALIIGAFIVIFLAGQGLGTVLFVTIAACAFVIIPVLRHFTWNRFVKVDHKYVIESAKIRFSDNHGKRDVVKFEKLVSSFSLIAPVTEEYKDKYEKADVTMDFRGSVKSPNSYFILDESDGKKTVIFFEATQQAIKVMSFYNSKGTVKSDNLTI